MFDYRALYESQPSVSVDFLRVVQSEAGAQNPTFLIQKVCIVGIRKRLLQSNFDVNFYRS